MSSSEEPQQHFSSTTTLLPHAQDEQDQNESQSALKRLLARLAFSRLPRSKHSFAPLPRTSSSRLDASLSETPLNAHTLDSSAISAAEAKGKTVLYLAYGSNLCKETFRGVRGIRPISQVNVVVPGLRLTFDLPGVPYKEPCFANTALRDENGNDDDGGKEGYHKNRWHKGLVGCVYEVTPSDYAHIIATEGGGSAYEDVLVECYPLKEGESEVPRRPETKAFKAHTLFAGASDSSSSLPAPLTKTSTDSTDKNNENDIPRRTRPDPSYAQPSARYLNLLTTGATELSLPPDYQSYLDQIRPYRITTVRQQVGQATFLALWMPIIMAMFKLQAKLQDEKGKAPAWLARLNAGVFVVMWGCYDVLWKGVFGNGERTIEDEVAEVEGEGDEKGRYRDVVEEKEVRGESPGAWCRRMV